MKPLSPTPGRRGMVIFEVLAALLIFGLAAVGLLRSITGSAQTAVAAQVQMRMLLRLQSVLNEVSKHPRIEDVYNDTSISTPSNPDSMGIVTKVEIKLIEDVITQIDKQPVNDMYRIKVTGYYEDFGQVVEHTAETVRYARLYAPQGAGAAPTNPNPPQNR